MVSTPLLSKHNTMVAAQTTGAAVRFTVDEIDADELADAAAGRDRVQKRTDFFPACASDALPTGRGSRLTQWTVDVEQT